MIEQRQIEEAAKIDGYLAIKKKKSEYKRWMGKYEGEHGDKYWTQLPDYSTDYNAAHRLIAGMDLDTMKKYLYHLTDGCIGWLSFSVALSSTCAEMLEAVLKAYGVWEERNPKTEENAKSALHN